MSSTSANSDTARYTNRLQARTPAPGVASPWSIRLASPIVPACTVAQSWTACSRIGTRVRISTVRPPAQTSTAPCPYWAMPSSTSVMGPAMAGLLEGAIRRATRDRLCQNTAPASSRLSKKSSSEYTRSPQLASTEWYRALPGAGQRGPALQTATRPGVYVMAKTTYRAANRPALSTSARNVPMRGIRCRAGQSCGICVGRPVLAGSVCQMVSLSRIVDGLSQ